MKNFLLNIILILVFLFSCNQMNTDKTENPTGKEQKSDTTNRTVKLSLEFTDLKSSELLDVIKVTMTNHTNDTITTGEHFRIENFEQNEWVDFTPKDIAFHDIGYILKPDSQKVFSKRLFKNQIIYNPGKYRIVKYYLKPDYQETKDVFYIYAEFEVN